MIVLTVTSTGHDLQHRPSPDYGYQVLGDDPMQRPTQTHELMCMW